jgi:hypothetical protein
VLLYLRRPSELAEQGMENTWYRTALRIICSVCAALMGGLYFYSMMIDSAGVVGWCVFGILLFGIMTFGVINVICTRSFKSFLNSKIQLVTLLAVSAVIFIGFYYNWYGYDSYLPDLKNVESAYIYSSTLADSYDIGFYSLNADGILTETASTPDSGILSNRIYHATYTAVDTEGLYEMLNSCRFILSSAEKRKLYMLYNEEYSEQKLMSNVYVQFKLKSGKIIERCYMLSVNDELYSFLDTVVSNDEYMSKYYPISTGKWKSSMNNITLTRSYNRYIDYDAEYSYITYDTSEATAISSMIITDTDVIEDIMETYREEFSEHSPVKELIDYTVQIPYTIEFYYVSDQSSETDATFVKYFSISVPESYTRTISYLDDYMGANY